MAPKADHEAAREQAPAVEQTRQIGVAADRVPQRGHRLAAQRAALKIDLAVERAERVKARRQLRLPSHA